MKQIILMCLAIATACADDDVPSFSWDGNTLMVAYVNGESDYADMIDVLEEETDDEEDDVCIMFGNFEIEDIPVALTGCPGDTTFDVVFDSVNTPDSVFEVRDGVVCAVAEEEPGTGVDDEDDTTIFAGDADRIENIEDPEIRKLLERSVVDDREIPTEFEVTLSIRYDKLFLENVANGNHKDAKTRVHSVINLARPYFQWPSLGSKVSLKILDIDYVPEYLQLADSPGGTLKYAETLTEQNDKEADNYHYFSYDTNAGCAGIARCLSFGGGIGSGSFCLPAKYKGKRTAISEWMQSDAKTSLTFAHELGHSMGMPHDFCSVEDCSQTTARNFPRRDRAGNECWGNSIMDYYQPTVDKWSTCSKEKVADWASDIVKMFGQHCKDTSPPPCEDLCPGDRCTISAPDLCQNPSMYGGCNGGSKSFFDANCKKTCGLCSDGSTAPAPPPPAPTACDDLCPGAQCTMSPNTLCDNPGNFGGCDGIYSAYFEQYCKKTCNKC